MEYFLVMYDSRVVIYERKMFIRLPQAATAAAIYCSVTKIMFQCAHTST